MAAALISVTSVLEVVVGKKKKASIPGHKDTVSSGLSQFTFTGLLQEHTEVDG